MLRHTRSRLRYTPFYYAVYYTVTTLKSRHTQCRHLVIFEAAIAVLRSRYIPAMYFSRHY